MSKVFLGGTCNNSTWREELIPILERNNISYFNPVVKDWNEAAYQNELKERETADFVLYTITPKMVGFYSIAEAVDDSNKRPKKTIFYRKIDNELSGKLMMFSPEQSKSLTAVEKMILKNGGMVAESFQDIVNFVNK